MVRWPFAAIPLDVAILRRRVVAPTGRLFIAAYRRQDRVLRVGLLARVAVETVAPILAGRRHVGDCPLRCGPSTHPAPDERGVLGYLGPCDQ